MESKRTHYEVLGVRQDATPEHIEDRYKRERASNHPDKYPSATSAERAQLEANFREIEQAYAVLSDDERRREYDRALRDAAAAKARASNSAGAADKGTDSGDQNENDPDTDDEDYEDDDDHIDEATYARVRAWVVRYQNPYLNRIRGRFDLSHAQACQALELLADEGIITRIGRKNALYGMADRAHTDDLQQPDTTASESDAAADAEFGARSIRPSGRQILIGILAVLFLIKWLSYLWTSVLFPPEAQTVSTPTGPATATPSAALELPAPRSTAVTTQSASQTPAGPVASNASDQSMDSTDTSAQPEETRSRGSLRDSGIQLGKVAPSYPAGALRDGHEGTVTLEVAVDADGHVTNIRIEHSSGYRDLDQAAIEAIPHIASPEIRNGLAVPGVIEVPVTYRLDGE